MVPVINTGPCIIPPELVEARIWSLYIKGS
jgi:hypothetical protein